jgi:hypothetical protein
MTRLINWNPQSKHRYFDPAVIAYNYAELVRRKASMLENIQRQSRRPATLKS